MQIIEENSRMGKTRDLFKKIRDTKGTCHGKMGSMKGRNGMDLTEAEDNIVLVLPYINMNPPRVYMCSPS